MLRNSLRLLVVSWLILLPVPALAQDLRRDGARFGTVEADGTVRIKGEKVGRFEQNGGIRVAGIGNLETGGIMADPNQLFVTNAITRGQIAEDLNDYLEALRSPHRLALDDDRLTDEICANFAGQVGNLDEGSSDHDDQYLGLLYDLGERLGFIMPDQGNQDE